MREIKFRVWSTLKEKMFHDDFYLSIDDTLFQNDDLDYRSKDYYKIMQYTGLKDKNGKEIYEGDILKGKVYGLNNGAKRLIGKVEYRYNRFVVVGVKQYKGLVDELNTTYEIIGNIYINPSLVEG